MALTTAGIITITARITGTGTPFDESNTYIGVGDGTTAVDVGQTDLQGTNTLRKAMDSGYPTVTDNVVVYQATFDTDEANFAWNEWGIFNASVGGTMMSREVESNGTKQDNQEWVLRITQTFTT